MHYIIKKQWLRLFAASVAIILLSFLSTWIANAQSATNYHYTVTRGTMASSMPAPNGGNNINEHGFRFTCVPSHYSYDDPVVFPGESGKAHLHMFYGNTDTNYMSTSASITNSGRSTCDGGITNRSAYWVPALFNANGDVVLPKTITNYYKSWVSDRSKLKPIPQGLQILANSAVLGSSGVVVAPAGHPEATHSGHIRVSDHDGLSIEVIFPDCVAVDAQGKPVLTSPGGTSHVAYSNGANCPASHPYNIPQLTEILHWDNVPYTSDWHLSSDVMQDAPKGTTAHADYIAGWTTEGAQIMVDCIRDAFKECGPPLQKHWKDQFFAPNGDQVYDFFRLADGVRATILAGWPASLTSGNTHTTPPTPVSTHTHQNDTHTIATTNTVSGNAPQNTDMTHNTTPSAPATTRAVTTETLNVRATANGTKVGVQRKGALGTMKNATKMVHGAYTWVYVDFDTAPDGYVADAFLATHTEMTNAFSEANTTSTDLTNPTSIRSRIQTLIAELQKLLALYARLTGTPAQ